MKLRDGGDIMYLKGPEMRHKGFAIILVLATLVLLAMLSLTYIKLALIDRNIARNYMDNKRAQLIAQSGVDYALAKLQENPLDTSWQQTKIIKINGIDTNYTESAGSTYGQDCDIFRVEVKDCNSMLNVNDGLGNARVRANLARIINALAAYLNSSEGKSLPANIGEVITNRTEKYSQKTELLTVLTGVYGSSLAEQYFKDIKDYLTTYSWQDPNVANPVPLSDEAYAFGLYPVKYNQNIGRYRYGVGKSKRGDWPSVKLTMYQATLPAGTRYAIFGLDDINPQWIEIVSRSPVNINTASKEVLYSLLYKLRGFFISERKRPWPTTYDSYSLLVQTTFMNYNYGWGAGNDRFGQLGFIFPTEEIVNAAGYNDPATIADEIIKCREKRDEYSDTAPTVLWFRGPFKTWRQFNAFCDYLITRQIINETRSSIFIEYYAQTNSTDYSTPSLIGRQIATQAIADVLKANFNPNLHLNETNPDANLHTLVDKTDLIVNSTEFCFTPMGFFDIESHGWILRPVGSDNRIIADQKIAASVKLFDAYRETNQKQFLDHITSNDFTASGVYLGQYDDTANSNRTIEIGPEPSHIFDISSSLIAKENEYSGYVVLPTLKGIKAAGGVPLTLYTNLTSDFDAIDGSGSPVPINKLHNIGDPTEGPGEKVGIQGPYLYGSRYRLARSYRQNDGKTYDSIAPADFRVDGAYVERFAGLAYNVASSAIDKEGVASYWIKPWFYPESTGRVRTYFSLSQYRNYCTTSSLISGPHPGLFFHMFLPSRIYDSSSYTYAQITAVDDQNSTYGSADYPNRSSHKSECFLFGFSTYNATATNGDQCGGGFYSMTRSLNHSSHYWRLTTPQTPFPCITSNKPKYFIKGQWIHVIIEWHVPPATPSTKIYINSSELIGTTNLDLRPYHDPANSADISDFQTSVLGIKMGEPGIDFIDVNGDGITDITADDVFRNFTCDSTIDEFYIFRDPSNAINDAKRMWITGRYYKPDNPSTSTFTSQRVNLYSTQQVPASPSTIPAPSGPLGGAVDSSTTNVRVIGLSWTWYAEGTDNLTARKGEPIIKNYTVYENTQSSDPGIQSSTYLYPKVNLKLRLNGTDLATEYKDDSFSTVSNIELKSTDDLRYKVIFNLEKFDGTWTAADRNNAILLYTPIFDDITIYYTQGTQFVSYYSE